MKIIPTSINLNTNNKIKDLTGKRFGKLLVLSCIGTVNGRAKWKCLCDCGIKTSILSNNLRKNKENRCGKCSKLGDKEALARIIYRDYRHRAINSSLEFSLSLDKFKYLISKNCFYCGEPPQNSKNRCGKTFPYNGVDRIDSEKGYFVSNVRPCCGICNTMKMRSTEDAFKAQIDKIYNHWISEDIRL